MAHPLEVPPRPAGDEPVPQRLRRAVDQRHRRPVQDHPDPGRAAHLVQVAQQAEARHIGRGPRPGLERGLRGVPVQSRHHLDRGGGDLAGGLHAVVQQAHPERLGQRDRQACLRGVVAQQTVRAGGAGDGHAVLGFGIVDRVPADDRHSGLLRDRETAGEHLLQQLVGQDLAGPADEVDRDHGVAAHRVDVAERVRGRDPSPVVGVVDHGGEEVRGGEHGRVAVGPADPHGGGVIPVVQAHDHLVVLLPGEGGDDLLELARRDLGGAAASVRHRGQADLGAGQGLDGGVAHGPTLARAARGGRASSQVRR